MNIKKLRRILLTQPGKKPWYHGKVMKAGMIPPALEVHDGVPTGLRYEAAWRHVFVLMSIKRAPHLAWGGSRYGMTSRRRWLVFTYEQACACGAFEPILNSWPDETTQWYAIGPRYFLEPESNS